MKAVKYTDPDGRDDGSIPSDSGNTYDPSDPSRDMSYEAWSNSKLSGGSGVSEELRTKYYYYGKLAKYLDIVDHYNSKGERDWVKEFFDMLNINIKVGAGLSLALLTGGKDGIGVDLSSMNIYFSKGEFSMSDSLGFVFGPCSLQADVDQRYVEEYGTLYALGAGLGEASGSIGPVSVNRKGASFLFGIAAQAVLGFQIAFDAGEGVDFVAKGIEYISRWF